MTFLIVALGGFTGSITRYYISVKANKFPIGTWIANITGSSFLAIILHFHLAGIISNWLWLFLGTGFCGAYTTFSTFGNETLELIINKEYQAAIVYIISSLGVSLLFVVVILFSLNKLINIT